MSRCPEYEPPRKPPDRQPARGRVAEHRLRSIDPRRGTLRLTQWPSTEVAMLFGTRVAETILASVHVRAHQQAGHMDASDLIKALQNALRGGGRSLIAPPLSTGFCLLLSSPYRGHGSLRGRRLPPQHLVRSTSAAMSTTGSRAAHAAQGPLSQSARTLAPEGNSHPRQRAARMDPLLAWSGARRLLGPAERLAGPPDAVQDHR
jgi:hypothetical protein